MITKLLIAAPSQAGNNYQYWHSCYIDVERRHVLVQCGNYSRDPFGLSFQYLQGAYDVWRSRCESGAKGPHRFDEFPRIVKNGRTRLAEHYFGFHKKPIGDHETLEIEAGVKALFLPVRMDFFTGCVIKPRRDDAQVRGDFLHDMANLARRLSRQKLEWSDGTSLYALDDLSMKVFILYVETVIPKLSPSQITLVGGRSSDSYNQRIISSLKGCFVEPIKELLGITSVTRRAITKSIERHARNRSLDPLAVLRLLAAAQVVAEKSKKKKPKMNMADWLAMQDQRMQSIFGNRIIADSAAVPDEQRAERE